MADHGWRRDKVPEEEVGKTLSLVQTQQREGGLVSLDVSASSGAKCCFKERELTVG